MAALLLLLFGFKIAIDTEEIPQWVKRIFYIFLIVLGIVGGALGFFKLP